MYSYKKLKISRSETRDEHRVIMEQILGRSLGRNEVVHHKNGDRRDNRVENLEVMSLSEHSRNHMRGHPAVRISADGIKRLKERFTGEKNPKSKLNPDLVRMIRSSNLGPRELGRKLGLSHAIISQVKSRIRWNHVPDLDPAAMEGIKSWA